MQFIDDCQLTGVAFWSTMRLVKQKPQREMGNEKLAAINRSKVHCGCATLTNDPITPVALSFSDGSSGQCKLQNKHGIWEVTIPTTASIRRSDDPLKYDCKTKDGRTAVGSLESTIGAKIVASAVFFDFGIVDSITDKHREYPASFVIPIQKRE